MAAPLVMEVDPGHLSFRRAKLYPLRRTIGRNGDESGLPLPDPRPALASAIGGALTKPKTGTTSGPRLNDNFQNPTK